MHFPSFMKGNLTRKPATRDRTRGFVISKGVSDAPEVREAPAERFSPRLNVVAEPGWYSYSVSVASAGTAYAADPHVIVTEP
jgi:hypothetical protein